MATDPGGGSAGNPYIPYLYQVQSATRLRAPPAFRTRLLTLKVLSYGAGIAAVAHLSLLLLNTHRKGWRSFWIFRLVPRPSGRVIVTNSKMSSCLMSLICLILQVCYLSDVGKFVLHKESQRLTVAFRVYSATCDVSHLWLLTWAQQQAFLAGLKGKEGERDIISARVLNTAFVGVGTALFVATHAAAAHASVLGARWYACFEVLNSHLESLAASWTPEMDVTADMMSVAPEALTYVTLGAQNNTSSIVAYSVTTAIVIIILIVNLVSLAIVYIIKRRRAHQQILDLELISAHDLTLKPFSTTASSTHGSKGTETKPSSEYKLSTTEIRILASQKHTMAGVQAQQLLAARKAERDLVLMACWCGAIAALGTGLGIWVTVPLLSQGQWQTWENWPIHEAALTLLQWLYATLLLGLYPSLIYTAWRNLSPSKTPCRLASKVDFSLHSPFHSRQRPTPAYRAVPRAGAAPSGRVRVIVEEQTREEYRHDLPSLETHIEGAFVPTSTTAIPETGAPRGGEGLGVAWVKPSWAGPEEAAPNLPMPEPVLGKRGSKASSLRWEVGSRNALPHESTAAHQVTPWAWYDRRPSS